MAKAAYTGKHLWGLRSRGLARYHRAGAWRQAGTALSSAEGLHLIYKQQAERLGTTWAF